MVAYLGLIICVIINLNRKEWKKEAMKGMICKCEL